MNKSQAEQTFSYQLRIYGIDHEEEYRFHDERKWRFDFAFPDNMLAVEIEGGTWSGGRHTRGQGFQDDCVKYNTAVKIGWRVLRYTTNMIENGEAIDDIIEILGLS